MIEFGRRGGWGSGGYRGGRAVVWTWRGGGEGIEAGGWMRRDD